MSDLFASNVELAVKRLPVSESKLSAEATGDRNWIGKVKRGEINAKAFSFLQFLHRFRGVRGWEMLQPPVTHLGEVPNATWIPNRKKTRPPLDEIEEWMKTLNGEYPESHPYLEYCNVFERPKRRASKVKAVAVGRLSVLAIEADITTPELMNQFIENSSTRLYRELASAMVETKPGSVTKTIGKKQALYLPPDRFEVYTVDTVMTRCVGDKIINYAQDRGCRWARSSKHPFAGGSFPALLEQQD